MNGPRNLLMVLASVAAFLPAAHAACPSAPMTPHSRGMQCTRCGAVISDQGAIVGHACTHRADWEKQGCFTEELPKHCGGGGAAAQPPSPVESFQALAKQFGWDKGADLDLLKKTGADAERMGAVIDRKSQDKLAVAQVSQVDRDEEEDRLYGGDATDDDDAPDAPVMPGEVAPKIGIQGAPRAVAVTHGPVKLTVVGAGSATVEWTSTDGKVLSIKGTDASGAEVLPVGFGVARIVARVSGARESWQTEEIEVVPPVLFLHGLASNTATWDGSIPALVKLWGAGSVVRNGAMTLPGDLYLGGFRDNNGSYIRQGREVAGWVAAILGNAKHANPEARKVVLVGHSMGGLASRSYLEGFAGAYRDDVAALVTLGTPHRGSIMAQLKLEVDGGPLGLPEIRKSVLKGTAKLLGISVDFDSAAVKELAVIDPNMKLLAKDATKLSALKEKGTTFVSVVGTLPETLSNALTSETANDFVSYGLGAGETYKTLQPLIARSDGLVDEASQDLNCLQTGLARVIRLPNTHHMAETAKGETIASALALTGRFKFLPSRGADSPVCATPRKPLEASLPLPDTDCAACVQEAEAARAAVLKLIAMRQELIDTNALLQTEVERLYEVANAAEDERKKLLGDSLKSLGSSIEEYFKVSQYFTSRVDRLLAGVGKKALKIKDQERLRRYLREFVTLKKDAEHIADAWKRYRTFQETGNPKDLYEGASNFYFKVLGVVTAVIADLQDPGHCLRTDPDALWALAELIGGPTIGPVKLTMGIAVMVTTWVTAATQVDAHMANIDRYLKGLRSQQEAIERQFKLAKGHKDALAACVRKNCPVEGKR